MDTTRPRLTTAIGADFTTGGDETEITTLPGQTDEPDVSTIHYAESTTRDEKDDGPITTLQPQVEETEIPEGVTTENAVTITRTDTTHDTTQSPPVTPMVKGKTQKPTPAKPFDLTPFDTTRKPSTLQPGSQHTNITKDIGVGKITTTSRPKGRTPKTRPSFTTPTLLPGTMRTSTPRVLRPSTISTTDEVSTYTAELETELSKTTMLTTEIDISTVKTPSGVTKKTETTFMTETLPSTTETPDCTKMPCLNEGTCFFSKQGPKVCYPKI